MSSDLNILLISFFYQIASQIGKPLVPIVAHSFGASAALIGFLVAVQHLLPLFLAIPTGQLVDALGSA